jgi:hypothetical protein
MSHAGHEVGAGTTGRLGLVSAIMPPHIMGAPRARSIVFPLSVSLLAAACAVAGDAGDGGLPPGFEASTSTPDSASGAGFPDSRSIFAGADGSSAPDGASSGDGGGLRADGAAVDAPSGRDGPASSPDATVHDAGVDSATTDAPTHDGALHDGAVDAARDVVTNETGAADVGAPDAGPCALGHLVISQVESRGTGGGNDEFIDLYNPTAAAVTLDATWVVDARSNSASTFGSRWAGTSKPIPPLGHYLLVGSAYSGGVASDGTLSSGITDASSVRLTHGGLVVDALCYAYSAGTTTTLEGASYGCPGTPATNPHDDTTSTDSASSLERAPGGAAGNCTDTGDSSHDFKTKTPSTPQDTSSAATP